MQHHVVDILEELAGFITLMKEAVSSSEMSVNIYQTTWHYILKDCHLHLYFSVAHGRHKKAILYEK
jgi:hypothetical protein